MYKCFQYGKEKQVNLTIKKIFWTTEWLETFFHKNSKLTENSQWISFSNQFGDFFRKRYFPEEHFQTDFNKSV